jgi:hypothetical protein
MTRRVKRWKQLLLVVLLLLLKMMMMLLLMQFPNPLWVWPSEDSFVSIDSPSVEPPRSRPESEAESYHDSRNRPCAT